MKPRSFIIPVLTMAACLGALASVQPSAQQRGSGGTGLSEPPATGPRGPSGLGRPANARELAAWDISIGPDGAELPPGSGNATQGALAFTQRACSTCHGPTGIEGPAPVLVGGKGGFEESYYPIVTWPFATMIWDFIHRAMPYDRPGRLTPDEARRPPASRR